MDLGRIHQAIDNKFDQHLAAIQEFLRVPSISNEGVGMDETAEFVKRLITDVGGSAEICPTAGYPIVYGELDAGRDKTLLIYGMYDVQPVAGEEWFAPPFAAQIVDLPEMGKCLVARGVFNTKGPLRGFFNVLSLLRQMNEIPVNLKFLIEGEEEMGSKHLPDFVLSNRERLRADAVFFPFYSQDRNCKPIIYLGCKGLLYLELACQGGQNGGPVSRDVHSSFAAWISSPAWRLVHALASLTSPDESISIENFYANVKEPTHEDDELLDLLGTTFDEASWLKEADARKFKIDMKGRALLRHYLFSPTVTIDGLSSGYEGPGMKTVLPHVARAKVDIRLVPGMKASEALSDLREHLGNHGFSDVKIEILGSYGPSKVSPRENGVQALVHAYRHHGFEPQMWPMIGGSAPFYLFTEVLGIPIVMGGLGHGGRAHSPNEYATVEGMKLFEKSVATFLTYFSGCST
jgi:acetylornithine deacetylase/succinyl-diaminopimelate desuccinylase-like protein